MNNEKENLLLELNNETFVMLKPSAIAGVGVFAIKPIPKGCRAIFSKPNKNDKWITITKEEFENLPDHSKFLVGNYCLYDEQENYFVPADGFKKMDVLLFINHSDKPNIISINDGDYFEAIRDIETDEELFLDYGEIV